MAICYTPDDCIKRWSLCALYGWLHHHRTTHYHYFDSKLNFYSFFSFIETIFLFCCFSLFFSSFLSLVHNAVDFLPLFLHTTTKWLFSISFLFLLLLLLLCLNIKTLNKKIQFLFAFKFKYFTRFSSQNEFILFSHSIFFINWNSCCSQHNSQISNERFFVGFSLLDFIFCFIFVVFCYACRWFVVGGVGCIFCFLLLHSFCLLHTTFCFMFQFHGAIVRFN